MRSKIVRPSTEHERTQRLGFPEALRNPCPLCGAEAGETCRPASMRVPHLPRIDLMVVPRIVTWDDHPSGLVIARIGPRTGAAA